MGSGSRSQGRDEAATSPYARLENRAFWRSAVANRHPAKLADLYRKKFVIREDERIATAGSCFAQHIASRLRSHGYNVLDAEPTPYAFDRESAHKFGFGLYSARYGNIYTVRQLLQLVLECQGLREPAEIVWTRGGRCFDALRPTVEPDGLASAELVRLHRDQHLGRVRQLFYETTLLVFTLGLTETWEHRGDGTVYPTAPGTVAGDFSPETYAFKNLAYHEIVADFLELRARLREASPGIRFLLTVSPVPLTATASGDHVFSRRPIRKRCCALPPERSPAPMTTSIISPPTKSSPARRRAASTTRATCATSQLPGSTL